MLTLLTATGGRPKAFSILEKLMLRQTYQGPVHWVIVDDVLPHQPVTFEREGWTLDVTHPGPLWSPGQNTQARNLVHGLSRIAPDARVVIIEDDDHYAPGWLDTVNKALDKAELVGESHAKYYNVATRTARQLNNAAHASLCSTALRGNALDTLRRVCQPGVKFIDINLWKQHPSKYLFRGNGVVGIKGMPGRGGIGMGHRPDFQGTRDGSLRILKSWIGKDAELYL